MEEDEEKDTGDFTESYDGDQDVIGQFQGDGAGLPQQVEAVPNNFVQNQPYDESVEVSDPEEVPSNNPTPRDQDIEYYNMGGYANGGGEAEEHPQNMMSMEGLPSGRIRLPESSGSNLGDRRLNDSKHSSGIGLSRVEASKHTKLGEGSMASGARGGGKKKVMANGRAMDIHARTEHGVLGGGGAGGNEAYNPEEEEEEEESEQEQEQEQTESEDTEESEATTPLVGVYDPNEYAQLPVSKDIKELFKHITRYKPQVAHLETKLKPFIPELIPAIGDIDAFLKVQRPGERPENLGLSCLDEPKVKQSDPTLLDLTLRTLSKQTTVKPMTVRSIEDPEKQVKDMDAWTNSISELHRQKPATTVHYSRNMPDIENLMQEWPAEFQESLKEVELEFLPSAELSCDLKEFADIVCALTDIPVYKSRVQALHVFFSLFMEFKNSQHFQNSGGDPDRLSI